MHVEYIKRIKETGSMSTKQRPGGFVLELSGVVCVCTHNHFFYHYSCRSRKDFGDNVSGTSDAIQLLTDPPFVIRIDFCAFGCGITKL